MMKQVDVIFFFASVVTLLLLHGPSKSFVVGALKTVATGWERQRQSDGHRFQQWADDWAQRSAPRGHAGCHSRRVAGLPKPGAAAQKGRMKRRHNLGSPEHSRPSSCKE